MEDVRDSVNPESTYDHGQPYGAGGASLSLFMCSCIIVTATWIRFHKSARHFLDRVSLRIFIWAMCTQIFGDTIFLIMFSPGTPLRPWYTACNAMVVLFQGSMSVVNYLFTCIAINLMLTIRFGVNVRRYHLERYYIGCSYLFGILMPLIAACRGRTGWDAIYGACYYRDVDMQDRIRELILGMWLWQAIACLIASISIIVTLHTIFVQARRTRSLLNFPGLSQPELLLGPSSGTISVADSCNHRYVHPFSPRRAQNLWRNRKACPQCEKVDRAAKKDGASEVRISMNQLQDRFFGVAIRIAMYPLTLIFLYTLMAFADLYTAVHARDAVPPPASLFAFFQCLNGGRGLCFAGVGLLVDPTLLRGLKQTWKQHQESRCSNLSTVAKSAITAETLQTPLQSDIPVFENIDPKMDAGLEQDLGKEYRPDTYPLHTLDYSGSNVALDRVESTGYLPVRPGSVAESCDTHTPGTRLSEEEEEEERRAWLKRIDDAKTSIVPRARASTAAPPPPPENVSTCDLRQILAATPPVRSQSRFGSIASSLDIQQVLSMGPTAMLKKLTPNFDTSRGRRSSLPVSAAAQVRFNTSPDGASTNRLGRPSQQSGTSGLAGGGLLSETVPQSEQVAPLPRAWQDAFSPAIPLAVQAQHLHNDRERGGVIPGQYMRNRREAQAFVRNLEKLFEEAEAQL